MTALLTSHCNVFVGNVFCFNGFENEASILAVVCVLLGRGGYIIMVRWQA